MSVASRTIAQHSEACISGALDYFDKGDKITARNFFITQMKKHERTAPAVANMLLAMLQMDEAAAKGRSEFEELMKNVIKQVAWATNPDN